MKKGEEKKKKKTKKSVTEDINNDSSFTLILSPKGWPIRAIDVRLHHVPKSPMERLPLAKSSNLQWKKTFIPTGTPIYLHTHKKKKPVTIFKLHGDQKEKKSELRTESANSLLEIIIRQVINIWSPFDWVL